MKTQELIIKGMSCGHCIINVRKGLGNVPGLTVKDVRIGRALVQYDETKVTREQIDKTIAELGYKLVSP